MFNFDAGAPQIESEEEEEANEEEENTAIPSKRIEGRGPPRSYTMITDEEYYYNYRDASGAWFLLPIFFGLLGGFIMWLALRK